MFLPVQAQRSFEIKKAPLLRRAALKITWFSTDVWWYNFYTSY
jgi:hypothetical protein